jgi:phytoene dehydrogenase-like protein
MSPVEVIDSFGFESEEVRTALLHIPMMWGIDPEVTGIGYLIPLYIHVMLNCSIIRGGSHRLSSAITKVYLANKGEVLDTAEVSKVIVKDGEARGVELTDGRKFESKAVASTVDPHQTFLKFLDEGEIDLDIVSSAKRWEWEEVSLFDLHLSLKELPKYVAADFDPDVERSLVQVMGYETMGDLTSSWRNIIEGKLPHPAGHATLPTVFDRSQGPHTGEHVGRWETVAPYEPSEASWDDDSAKETFADTCLEKWSEYAPNLKKSNIINRYSYPPTYIEKKLTDMVRGSFKQGAYVTLQMGYFRPNDQCSNYRTPLKNYYVCGSSVYPGGMVLLAGGYNAASVIAEDLGIKPWWSTPDMVIEGRKKGLVP